MRLITILLFFLLMQYTWQLRPVLQFFLESQCIDTHRFILKSLNETIHKTKNLERIYDLQFVSFGNGNFYRNQNGTWGFSCQHGEVECYGNLMETCVFDLLPGFYQQADYLVCMHEYVKKKKEEYDYDAKKCLMKHPCLYEKVQKCMLSIEGNYLLKKAALMTKTTKVFYVPFVTLNGVHDYDIEFPIIDSLTKWVCNQFQGEDKSKYCLLDENQLA